MPYLQLTILLLAFGAFIVRVAQSNSPQQAYLGASLGCLGFWACVLVIVLQ